MLWSYILATLPLPFVALMTDNRRFVGILVECFFSALVPADANDRITRWYSAPKKISIKSVKRLVALMSPSFHIASEVELYLEGIDLDPFEHDWYNRCFVDLEVRTTKFMFKAKA